jgi:hypothetical protein
MNAKTVIQYSVPSKAIVVFIAAMEPKNAPPFKKRDVAIKGISSV